MERRTSSGEFDQDGQLLRTIGGPELERRPVPRAERADSMRALEARIDSLPVLEYDGRYAGTVVVPAPLLAYPPPLFGEDIIVGVVMDPVTDVHSVVVFRFGMPG